MRKLTWLVVIALLVGIALAIPAYYITRDAAPPQDDDLRVQRLDIPEKENAFYYFKLAVEQLYWPDDAETAERVGAMLDDDLWDEELAQELVERNAEGLQYLKQGLECSECQVPEIKGFDDLLPYLGEWRTLARLSSLRALWLLKGGRQREAADEAMSTVKFGHMIEGSRGGLLHYLVGCAVKAIALARLRDIAGEATLQPSVLIGYARALAAYGANEQGLEDVFRGEYAVTKTTVDDLAAGRYGIEDLSGEGSGGPRPGYVGYFFQPNKTKRIFAQTFRTGVSNVGRSYAQRDYSGPPEWTEDSGFLSMASLFLSGNAVGKLLVAMLLPAVERIHLEKCWENVSVAATQLLLALKAYELQTGNLPESLEELVPDYLAAIPVDDYDGRPMRYSLDKRIVYSVGEDLKDSGGSEGEHPWEMEDPSFRIE